MRLTVDDSEDWFLLQTPKRSNNGKQVINVVQCPHNSTLLKTKNLYLTYDDETGIGRDSAFIGTLMLDVGEPVCLSKGSEKNVKITDPKDILYFKTVFE